MPVGPVSAVIRQSATPIAAPPDKAPEPVVLRSGEKQASTQKALSDPNAKTYHHRIPGARFVMPDGLELLFLGGRLTTNEKKIIEELDKVADRSTSMIFTEKENIAVALAAEARLADEASKTQGKLNNDD